MAGVFSHTSLFSQPSGTPIKLVVYGDEFYARRETEDGYTAVFDATLGLFCYAIVINGSFISCGIPVTEPAPSEIRRHLHESPAIVKRSRAQRKTVFSVPLSETTIMPHGNMLTFGPQNGLLEGRRISEGVVRGLTVLVEFDDVRATVEKSEYEDLLNGDNYTGHGNISSVRQYYLRVSSGFLDYSNDVVGPIRLSKRRSQYINTLLVEEALEKVSQLGIDWSRYDCRGEGIVDAINFVYAGDTQFIGNLWPHNSYKNVRVGNLRTYYYMLTSMGASPDELRIGTFCHENGHMLCRFPDMYDYGTNDAGEGDLTPSAGIGDYCLMGSGNYNDDFGKAPSPVCAYLRHLVGWCPTVISLNQAGKFTAKQGAYDTVHIFRTSKPTEYFLIENRFKTDLDRGLSSSGLAIYHCDTSGSNEYQQNSADKHYQCALLQADGKNDLERNINSGDDKDLFGKVNGMAINSKSNPSSRMWDKSESGLTVSNITAPDKAITFETGQGNPSSIHLTPFHVLAEVPENLIPQTLARRNRVQATLK